MFCQKCGTQIPEGDHYCPTCGEPAVIKAKTPSESDHTAMFAAEDCAKTRLLAALCYFNFIFIIIALLLEPDSKFLRYHINQSLVLTVFGVVCGLCAIVPIIGWIVGVVGSVAALVFTIMGIVHAINREAKDLPIIGKYTIVNYD
ncbi:MAG: zinc-ribbon domain-containing protein [Oscillospiraceae bacterium]|nr:zinc-ribbon domain-containing protein [Oscillospiraceae bacterium]